MLIIIPTDPHVCLIKINFKIYNIYNTCASVGVIININ